MEHQKVTGEKENVETYEQIAYWNQNNQRERIKIRQNIVGEPIGSHRSSLGHQVIVQLIVRNP